MKAVSICAELVVLQRAVQGVADSLDVETFDAPVSDARQRQVVATLNLISCRLRDLERAARGSIPVEKFFAPHNAAVVGTGEDVEDVILYPVESPTGRRAKRRSPA